MLLSPTPLTLQSIDHFDFFMAQVTFLALRSYSKVSSCGKDARVNLPSSLSQNLRNRRQASLLTRASAGDERAFRRLYRELHPPVVRYVARRLRSPEDVEDVTSRVFHRFLENLSDFQPGRGSVRAWLFGITRNALIDHYRTRPEAKASHETLDSLAEHAGDPCPDALDTLIQDEEAGMADGLLRGQPAEIREMFALRFGEGLSTREIALVLNLSEATVRKRFSRIMRALKSRDRESETDTSAAGTEPRKSGEVDYAIE